MGVLQKSLLLAMLAVFAGVVPADADSEAEAAAADCTQKEDPDLAIARCTQFIQVIQSKPALAATYGTRGSAYAHKAERFDAASEERKKYMDQAFADFTKAITLDPSSAANWSTRGSYYGIIGENQKAIADLRHALDLNPPEPLRKDVVESLKALGIDAEASR